MRRSLELAGQALEGLLQRALRVVRRRGEAFADALDGEGEPLPLRGLEHVVDHPLLECVDRVLVVGGDEHDFRHAGLPRQCRDLARGFDAALGGHADVEKHDIGALGGDQLDRLGAVARLGSDLELGPDLGEAGAQLLAHQRLVVRDHRLRGHAVL